MGRSDFLMTTLNYLKDHPPYQWPGDMHDGIIFPDQCQSNGEEGKKKGSKV